MSRDIGKVKLHNGGLLEVTSYIGPTDNANRRRIQFTLTQAEGGIHAYGNTDADGVAELVGVLETWLLEAAPDKLGRKPRPAVQRDDVSLASVDGPAPSRAREELELEELPIWSRAGVRVRLARALELLTGSVVQDSLAYGRPASVAEELEKLLRGALERVNGGEEPEPRVRCERCDGTGVHPRFLEETPASDFLEEHDTVRGLEDYGALGEEADAFTRALNRRRNGQGPETAPGSAGVYTFGGVERAAAEARRALGELVKHCGALEHKRPADLTELGPLTHYAARFLDAKLTLGEALDAAARQGGDTLTSRER